MLTYQVTENALFHANFKVAWREDLNRYVLF